MTWEKPKQGGYEHKGHECSWSYQSTGRSIAQMTKAQCTGLSLVNISVWVFLQKELWSPKSLLKCVQNHPGHIYSIECKTSNKSISYAFVPPSEQKQVKMVLWKGRQISASSEMLANQLSRVLWWLTRLPLLSITDGLPVSNPRRAANECDLVIQSHQKLFCVTGKKPKTTNSWVSLILSQPRKWH